MTSILSRLSRPPHHGPAWLARMAALFFGTICLTCQATIWHISPEGSDSASGRSWQTPLLTLESAFARCAPGDELWLTAGEWHPEPAPAGGIVPAAGYRLPPGVSILGGFAGYESTPDQRPRHDRDGNGAVELWEYTAMSCLSPPPCGEGPLLSCDNGGSLADVLIDGLCFRDGRNGGIASCGVQSGDGGGVWLKGFATIRHCDFMDCTARRGGALFAAGDVAVSACRFACNDAAWSGGAVHLTGDGNSMANCILSDNGTPDGVLQGGGAIAIADGDASVVFCTFVGNASAGEGSALLAKGDGYRLENSLFWGNCGHFRSLKAAQGGTIRNCAVTAGGAAAYEAEASLALSPYNAGFRGSAFNDNRPATLYPCLADPAEGCFVPDAGSILINRGLESSDMPETDATGAPRCQHGIPDIGAYECDSPGQLALDFHADRPLYYASDATLLFHGDCQEASMAFRSDTPDVLSVDESSGSIHGIQAGEAAITMRYATVDVNIWAPGEVTRSIQVLRRPLHVRIDDNVWRMDMDSAPPAPAWKLAAGAVAPGDSLVGAPEYIFHDGEASDGGEYAIGAGSIAIKPSEAADNYAVSFEEGTLHCLGQAPTITIQETRTVYSGQAVVPKTTTSPAGLPVVLSYSRCDETAQGLLQASSETTGIAPVMPGEYLVTATFGSEAALPKGGPAVVSQARLVIEKAPLLCKADDISRPYGVGNPELTCSFSGFVGNDTADTLEELPTLSTAAGIDSPISAAGYPITVSGGSDSRYELLCEDGLLRVTRRMPELNTPAATVMTYGEPLSMVWLMGFALDPVSGDFLPGDFLWDDPECVLDAGCWECTWRFVPDDTELYCEVSGSSDITIALRPLGIAALPAGKYYGDDDPELPYAITHSAPARGHQLSGVLRRQQGEEPGRYAIDAGDLAITWKGRDVTGNYEVSFAGGDFVISKRPITITIADCSKYYGDDDPDFAWEITSGELLPGDAVLGRPARDAGERPGTYAILGGIMRLPDYYAVTFRDGTLTIKTTGLAVDEASLKATTITYGDALDGATQLSGDVKAENTGTPVHGTFRWLRDGDYPEAGLHELQWEFTPDERDRYGRLSGTAQIEVLPATLAVAVQDCRREYAAANPEFHLTVTGFVLGETESVLTASPYAVCSADTASMPGEYAIVPQGGAADNYRFEYSNGCLTVVRCTPCSADGVVASSSLTYGRQLREIQPQGTFADGTGTVISGTLEWLVPSLYPDTTVTEGQWRFTPEDRTRYTSIEGSCPLEVRPALLTVQALDATRQFGAAAELAYAITGYVLGEDAAVLTEKPSVSCPADASSPVGDYPIVVTGGAARDYVFEHLEGRLTIAPAQLAQQSPVQALNAITYGQSLEEIRLAGTLLRADGLDDMAIAGTLQWDEPGRLPQVAETTAAWSFIPHDARNYAELHGTAAIVVNPALLKVQAPDATRTYGDQTPILEPAVTGFVNGEDATVLLAPPVCQTSTDIYSDIGNYAIQAVGGSAANYIFEYTDGTLTIVQRPLVVHALQCSKLRSESDPQLEYTFDDSTSLVRGDTLTGRLAREEGEEAGDYAILQGTLAASANYRLTFRSEWFTILVLNAYSPEVVCTPIVLGQQGQADSILSGDFFDTETDAPVKGTLAWAEPEWDARPAGSHIRPWIFIPDDERYATVAGETMLEITRPPLVIGFRDQTISYGEAPATPEWHVVSGTLLEQDKDATVTAAFEGYAGEVGTYDIVMTGNTFSDNYSISQVHGKLTVTQRTIYIEPETRDYTRVYGDPIPEVAWKVTSDGKGTVIPEAGRDFHIEGGYEHQGGIRTNVGRSNYTPNFTVDNANYVLSPVIPHVDTTPFLVTPVYFDYERTPEEKEQKYYVDMSRVKLAFDDDVVTPPDVLRSTGSSVPGQYVLHVTKAFTDNRNYKWDTSVYGVLNIWYDEVMVVDSELYNRSTGATTYRSFTLGDIFSNEPQERKFAAKYQLCDTMEKALNAVKPGGKIWIHCDSEDKFLAMEDGKPLTLNKDITIQRAFTDAGDHTATLTSPVVVARDTVCTLVDINIVPDDQAQPAITMEEGAGTLTLFHVGLAADTDISCHHFGALDISGQSALDFREAAIRLETPVNAPRADGILCLADTAFYSRGGTDDFWFIDCQNSFVFNEDGFVYLDQCTFDGCRLNTNSGEDYQYVKRHMNDGESGGAQQFAFRFR